MIWFRPIAHCVTKWSFCDQINILSPNHPGVIRWTFCHQTSWFVTKCTFCHQTTHPVTKWTICDQVIILPPNEYFVTNPSWFHQMIILSPNFPSCDQMNILWLSDLVFYQMNNLCSNYLVILPFWLFHPW